MAVESKNKIKVFSEELKVLLGKHGLDLCPIIDFPKYKILPAEVKLALEVIKNHGAVMKINCLEANSPAAKKESGQALSKEV
jgi:hypothetical protein